jgi:hypothetical protein
LARHRNAQALFGCDQVVVVIVSGVELHPVDVAGEPALLGRVVVTTADPLSPPTSQVSSAEKIIGMLAS